MDNPDPYVRLGEEIYGQERGLRGEGQEVRLGFTMPELLSLAAHIV